MLFPKLCPPPHTPIYTIVSYQSQNFYRLVATRASENLPAKSNKGPKLLRMRSGSSSPQGQESGRCKLRTDSWSPALTARPPGFLLKPECQPKGCSPSRPRSVTESHADFDLSAKPSKCPKDTEDKFIGLIQFFLVWLLFLKIKYKQKLQIPDMNGPNCQLSYLSLDQHS